MTIAEAYERGWRAGLEDARQILLRASGQAGEGDNMGLEWHDRRRRRDGTFAPEDYSEPGKARVDLHAMISRETSVELRRRARCARQELGPYLEAALRARWAAEPAAEGGQLDGGEAS